jgi:lipopolysaccharide assembly outer membrane protein LptD (OstA)
MNRVKRFFCLAMMLALGGIAYGDAGGLPPALEGESLSEQSPFEYDVETQTMVATNGAIVKFNDPQRGDVVLTARGIRYSEKTGVAEASGGVVIQREGQLWRGEYLEYNFLSGEIRGREFRTGMAPFFAYGEGLTIQSGIGTTKSTNAPALLSTNQTYYTTNGVITTDDLAEPVFKVRAKRMKIIPGQLIEAHNAVVYVGKMPVMYFPFYSRKMTRHPNNWVLTPGFRSLYGPYMLTRYNWQVSDKLSAGMDLDYRQKRGGGYGPSLHYDYGRIGKGDFAFYYAPDDKPGLDPLNKPIGDDRHRIRFDYKVDIQTNLTAKVVLREQSDPYIIRDFFETEYRKNIEPSSFAEVNQLWPNWSLNVMAQPRVDDFYATVERLPDVKLSAARQQLGVSPFYYEGENSAGYFRYRSPDNLGTNYAALRADSYHQIVLPKNFFGWLNVTPRVGGRFTHYGESEGRYVDLTDQDRAVFNTGAEVSTKMSRTWQGAHNRFLEVDGIRHIFEPSVNYVYVPSPNVLPRQLPQFDSEMQSFRLLPIDYPDYNAIDSVDSQNVLRIGLRNKLQTKRKKEIDQLFDWALYTDWRIKPRPDQSTFADFYSDMDFKPRSWLALTSQTRYSLDVEAWREANHFITLQPNDTWSLALGHRYLRGEPAYGPDYGNNLITSRFYYRFDENWGFRIAHHYEARDGKLEEQYYTVYRDLRSWTSALTFRVRTNRNGEDDFTVAITFSLKAFPQFGLRSDSDSPSMLLGN